MFCSEADEEPPGVCGCNYVPAPEMVTVCDQ